MPSFCSVSIIIIFKHETWFECAETFRQIIFFRSCLDDNADAVEFVRVLPCELSD